MKAVALVGWTRAGRFEDLQGTALRMLAASPAGAARIDDTLLVDTDDPVSVARRLAFLPGVAWISVGYRFSGGKDYLRKLEHLAKRYLSKGRKFAISAQVVGSKEGAGDVVLTGNSALLSAIPGAKVSERRPQVRFRICIDGTRGACGVQIRSGPGGVPTGHEWVSCLVSGGERSSSLAWMSALSGFSLRLVHSASGEAPLRQVARLYSELSHRMDPGRLELVVLDGPGGPMNRIGRWLGANKGAVFTGGRPAPDELVRLARAFPNLISPLLVIQDETISATYLSLGIGRATAGPSREGFGLEALKTRGAYSERRFGGTEADPNEVIDSIRRRRG